MAMIECPMCGGEGGWPGIEGYVQCKTCGGSGRGKYEEPTRLDIPTKVDLPVERVCSAAADACEHVLIIGETESGDLWLSSSSGDRGWAALMLLRAMRDLPGEG